jgi:hypothetical protein
MLQHVANELLIKLQKKHVFVVQLGDFEGFWYSSDQAILNFSFIQLLISSQSRSNIKKRYGSCNCMLR